MHFLNLLFLYGILALTYATPIFNIVGWIRRLLAPRHATERWRGAALWVALVLVTVSDAIFWFFTFSKPYPQYYADAKSYVFATVLMAGLGLACALFGKGRGRWWSVVSAIGVPVSWLFYAVAI